ncbi:MAG TPA: ribosome maturation factor RimP [Steroidobacteraceae bacterium]|nr:ribosome maturation factor RimP [Steroidobacteraceae bacterium]
MRERLIELLEPLVRHLGYELWELEFTGRNGVLRLYIDSPEGIDIDDCETVSRAVSDRLDEADPVPGEYTLEVSSPGMDRVLRTEQHFERFIGEQVNVEMKQQVNGRRRFVGKLLKVSPQDIQIEMGGEQFELALENIHRARLSPQW